MRAEGAAAVKASREVKKERPANIVKRMYTKEWRVYTTAMRSKTRPEWPRERKCLYRKWKMEKMKSKIKRVTTSSTWFRYAKGCN